MLALLVTSAADVFQDALAHFACWKEHYEQPSYSGWTLRRKVQSPRRYTHLYQAPYCGHVLNGNLIGFKNDSYAADSKPDYLIKLCYNLNIRLTTDAKYVHDAHHRHLGARLSTEVSARYRWNYCMGEMNCQVEPRQLYANLHEALATRWMPNF